MTKIKLKRTKVSLGRLGNGVRFAIQKDFFKKPKLKRQNLESWFINLEQTPLNRSQQLPAPYKRLFDEIKQN